MATRSAEVTLQLGTERLHARFTVPEDPIGVADLLPIARAILAKVLESAEEAVRAEGKSVSCTKGCGACCRQLVPISRTEARMIAELVERMPEPRRQEVRRRFAEVREKLEAHGMWQRFEGRAGWGRDDVHRIGLEYFEMGIPCPFLEEESCSIHLDRPLTCREYLVTSPPENCARPTRENIEQVPLTAKVWPAIARFDPVPAGAAFAWTPLVMALEESRECLPDRPGPERLEEFFRNLTGKDIPGQLADPFAKD